MDSDDKWDMAYMVVGIWVIFTMTFIIMWLLIGDRDEPQPCPVPSATASPTPLTTESG